MTQDMGPDTRPGYCPVCNMKAEIFDSRTGNWCCCLCNWEGRQPNQKKQGWCRNEQRMV